MLVKMKCSMAKIAVKGLDEEDCLGIFGRDILNRLRVQQLQTDGIQRIDGVIAQKLIDGTKILGLGKPANCTILVTDDNSIRFRQLFLVGLRPYDAWLFLGDRSYCLILYRSAL